MNVLLESIRSDKTAGTVLAGACMMSAISQAVQIPSILIATCVVLFVFFALVWQSLQLFPRILLFLPLLLIVLLHVTGNYDQALVLSALERGTFLSLFVVTLSLIRVVALSSPFVRYCGQLIVHQPPGRRYFVLSFGAHLFGILLNFAALSLLGSMVRSSTAVEPGNDQHRIAMIRRKRMSLAVIRGFATIATWSPLSAFLAVLISLVPGTSLVDVIPPGLAIFVTFIMLGWVFDRFSYPRRNLPDTETAFRETALAFLGLLGIVITFVAAAGALSQISGMTIVNSLLFVVPLASIGWVYIQCAGEKDTATFSRVWYRVANEFPAALTELKAEATMFFSYGMLGTLILPFLRPEEWGAFFAAAQITQTHILIAAFWVIVAMAQLGVNPLLTVLVIASVVPQITSPVVDGVLLLIAIQFGWCTCIVFSPYTAASRILGSATGVPHRTMCLRWNLGFTLTWIGLASLTLVIAS